MKYCYNPISNVVEITEIPNRVDKIILTKDVLFKIPLHVLEINVKARRDMMEDEMEKLRDGITDDTRYILDKMERINDYSKLRSVLEALEVITAEI